MPPDDSLTARLSSAAVAADWLVLLRWHAVGGQATAIIIAAFAMHIALPVVPLFACVAAFAISNYVLATRPNADIGNGWIAGILFFDIAVLSSELALSGGATNPFAIFYLVQILLAGLLLPVRWVAGITLFTVVAYACQFGIASSPLAAEEQRLGKWIAFAFLALFAALITKRLADALRARHLDLLGKQRIAAHAEKLASLSTLAAGAAHELGSPLGTITVAAEELDQLIAESPDDAIEDARVIRDEVARCREIVHRMNARAGQLLGELPEPTTIGAIFGDLVAQASPSERPRLVVQGDRDEVLECPSRGLVRILGNLVNNAFHASDSAECVVVTAHRVADRVRFVVEDRGVGIPKEIQEKLGEPFVTTKSPGEGMGLGLFLSFAFAELCAGQLELRARDGGGTSARLELPRHAKVLS